MVEPQIPDLRERFHSLKGRIHQACTRVGRDPETVRLIAVSKGQSLEQIRAVYAAGQRKFGENYAQELAWKANALADLEGIEWHFLGHFQTNKAKIVAQHATLVHSIASAYAAKTLARRVQSMERTPLSVLIEVYFGGGAQRSGIEPSALEEVLTAVRDEPCLSLQGLMALAPPQEPFASKRVFDTLSTLRALYGGPALLPELSMGMSGDFEEAIAAGSTLVRIGTLLFGPRPLHPRAGDSPTDAFPREA